MLCRYRNVIAVYYDVKKHKYTFSLQNTGNFNIEIDNTYGKYCTCRKKSTSPNIKMERSIYAATRKEKTQTIPICKNE
jgi:hypothetical protein